MYRGLLNCGFETYSITFILIIYPRFPVVNDNLNLGTKLSSYQMANNGLN